MKPEVLILREEIENSLPQGRWHAALLERMTFKVKDLREPVISAGTKKMLDEIRRFRHFKRYYFELDYDWGRLDYLLGVYRRSLPQVREDLSGFLRFLDRIAG